jgi:N-acetylmuramoyl-L-alanine amidase
VGALSAHAAPLPLAGKVIVVDPGHGGADPGAIANGVQEKTVTLGVGLALDQLLRAGGATTVLTRSSDVTIGLAGDPHNGLQVRSSLANQAHGNLFVSIHANALDDPRMRGVTTYFGQLCGYVSGAQRDPVLIARSYKLATLVDAAVATTTGEVDNGVDSADYWVLGNTNMPAILVETGFLTNAAEARRLGTPSYQATVAQGIASGIIDYFANHDDTITLPPAPTESLKKLDDASFQGDVTVPDGTAVPAGTAFVKIWRLRNTGCTTWDRGFHLTFQSGDQMRGPQSVPVGIVDPGSSVNVSVPLVASGRPDQRGSWQMTNANGDTFGVTMWVTINHTAGPPGIVGAMPSLPTDRVAPTTDTAHARYFPQTGHNVAFSFLRYFDTRGGLDRFGYPRTEQILEGGLQVQYFQRARMEYHPEFAGTPYEVELSLIGDQLTTSRRPFPTVDPFRSTWTHVYFPETQHSVSFGFLKYVRSRGGVDSFGYPISEEFVEADALGRVHTVQYFQRARLEYHPEFAGTQYEVELGLLGDELLQARDWLP